LRRFDLVASNASRIEKALWTTVNTSKSTSTLRCLDRISTACTRFVPSVSIASETAQDVSRLCFKIFRIFLILCFLFTSTSKYEIARLLDIELHSNCEMCSQPGMLRLWLKQPTYPYRDSAGLDLTIGLTWFNYTLKYWRNRETGKALEICCCSCLFSLLFFGQSSFACGGHGECCAASEPWLSLSLSWHKDSSDKERMWGKWGVGSFKFTHGAKNEKKQMHQCIFAFVYTRGSLHGINLPIIPAWYTIKYTYIITIII
jgi:hypothetical protein